MNVTTTGVSRAAPRSSRGCGGSCAPPPHCVHGVHRVHRVRAGSLPHARGPYREMDVWGGRADIWSCQFSSDLSWSGALSRGSPSWVPGVIVVSSHRMWRIPGCSRRRRRSRCGTQELIECSPGWDCWAPSGAVGAAVMDLVSIDPVPERVGGDLQFGHPRCADHPCRKPPLLT
jgi:hypothetical protein